MGVTAGKFVLDGSTQYITTPLVTEVTGTSAVTFACWVKTTKTANGTLISYGDEATGERFAVTIGNARIGLYVFGANRVFTATGINDGTWKHIVCTLQDTGTVADSVIYMDGSSLSQLSIANGTTTIDLGLTNAPNIGRFHSGSEYVDGELDDIRLIARELDAAEVTTLYNNDIKDESGNGNNGTQAGAYVGEDDEIVFDGTDDYVRVTAPTAASEITISMWVTPAAIGSFAMNYALVAGPNGHQIRIETSGKVGVLFNNHSVINGTTILSAGTEYHIAATNNGTTSKLYIDGVEEASGSQTYYVPTGDGIIGAGSGGTGYYLNGSIRDFRMFDVAKTAAEVAFLASEYEVEVPNTKGSALSIVPSYDDWGNATLNAIDFSGNGNVGTLTNMTTGDWVADTDSGGTRAIDYDGTNDYVDVGAISLQGEASAAAWLKIATTAGGQDHIISDIPQSGLAQFSFEVNRTAGKLSITWGGTVVKTGSTTLSTDQWYHVAVVRSGSTGSWTAELFVDGVSDGSGTTSTNPSTQNKDFGIAHSIEPLVSSYMEGTTDDIYIWPRVLSLDEIKALASTRNYFDCPVVSAIIQTRRRRLSLSGGML
jgi:hypothetical protein